MPELTLKQLQVLCHTNAIKHGFWNKERNVGEQLALIHSEISEALEEYRKGHAPDCVYYVDKSGFFSKIFNKLLRRKPVLSIEGFGPELADAIIRIFDTVEAYNIDLYPILRQKMLYNEQRPYMHGKIF